MLQMTNNEIRAEPEEWKNPFESAGLHAIKPDPTFSRSGESREPYSSGQWERRRDLHVISISWICRGSVLAGPSGPAQAAALPLRPIGWEYQAYCQCKRK